MTWVQAHMGTLYIVGTPIGNLEDITLRAIRTLREVALIAAEDTRHARILLQRYDIDTPLISYFEHSSEEKRRRILKTLKGEDVALISEAGMPGLSDPGYDLIREAIECGIRIVPVPGPSALTSALAVSGLPTDSFVYLGFLPRRRHERRRTLEELADERRTLVLYEAPHRLVSTLRDMLAILGDRHVAVARELTKLHEEIFRGTLSQALERFEAAPPRGEFTLVIEGTGRTERQSRHDAGEALALARKLIDSGSSAREATAEVARRTGWSRRAIYNWLHHADSQPTSGD